MRAGACSVFLAMLIAIQDGNAQQGRGVSVIADLRFAEQGTARLLRERLDGVLVGGVVEREGWTREQLEQQVEEINAKFKPRVVILPAIVTQWAQSFTEKYGGRGVAYVSLGATDQRVLEKVKPGTREVFFFAPPAPEQVKAAVEFVGRVAKTDARLIVDGVPGRTVQFTRGIEQAGISVKIVGAQPGQPIAITGADPVALLGIYESMHFAESRIRQYRNATERGAYLVLFPPSDRARAAVAAAFARAILENKQQSFRRLDRGTLALGIAWIAAWRNLPLGTVPIRDGLQAVEARYRDSSDNTKTRMCVPCGRDTICDVGDKWQCSPDGNLCECRP